MAKRIIHAVVTHGVVLASGDQQSKPRRFFRLCHMNPVQRETLIAEAMTWLRTPYHPHARIKHHGVDCAQFLIGVVLGAGILPSVDVRRGYSIITPQGTEYVDVLLRYCLEIPEASAARGDIALYKTEHGWMHSAIILEWTE